MPELLGGGMDAGVDAGVDAGMDGDSDLEHPDRLRVRPAGKPVLDESPEWGRGPLKRLDQPSTLDLLARDVATARMAAAQAEEQEQLEAKAASERRRARRESLAVDAEARRSSVLARERELALKAAAALSAQAKQEQLVHNAVCRLQARVRGRQTKSSLQVFGQVATVIQAGARGMAARRATRPARMARRREVAAALVIQRCYRGRLVRKKYCGLPYPYPYSSPSFSPGPAWPLALKPSLALSSTLPLARCGSCSGSLPSWQSSCRCAD